MNRYNHITVPLFISYFKSSNGIYQSWKNKLPAFGSIYCPLYASSLPESPPKIYSGGDFGELVGKSTRFVYQTLFIKEIIEIDDKVILITIPNAGASQLISIC